MANVVFFGVRGSHPTPTSENLTYGGNTSCVVVYADTDEDRKHPIIFDLGTGLSSLAKLTNNKVPFSGIAFLSHLHFDHVQGLPFFSPIDQTGAELSIYGPGETGMSLEKSFELLFASPYFPVGLHDLKGKITLNTISKSTFELPIPGSPKITIDEVNHTNATLGFRLEIDGKSIVYIADHQAPMDCESVSESIQTLCYGADLLIHDAQYTGQEFNEKSHWGHSTYEFAINVAMKSAVRSLVFFHHDPMRSDSQLAGIEEHFMNLYKNSASIFAAKEGMDFHV